MKKKKLEAKLSKAKKKLNKIESELAELKSKQTKLEKSSAAKPALTRTTKSSAKSATSTKKAVVRKESDGVDQKE